MSKATETIVVETNHGPGRPLPTVQAFVEQHRAALRSGVHQVAVEHQGGCTYTSGGPCICIPGPTCKLMSFNPAAN